MKNVITKVIQIIIYLLLFVFLFSSLLIKNKHNFILFMKYGYLLNKLVLELVVLY
jgi:hypothetical protein